MIEAETVEDMDDARRLWCERVSDAAHRAADELRALDEPYTDALLEDLDGLSARLDAELRANGTGPA